MRRPYAVGLAAALVVLYVLMAAGQVFIWWQIDQGPSARSALPVLFLAYPLVGLLIIAGRGSNPIGWILAAVGPIEVLVTGGTDYAYYALHHPGTLPLEPVVIVLANTVWTVMLLLLAVLLPLLFPTGRLLSRRWLIVIGLALAYVVLVLAGNAFVPGSTSGFRVVPNPIAITGHHALFDALASASLLPGLAALIAVVASVFVRYRRADRTQRQQMKWFLASACLIPIPLVLNGDAPWGYIAFAVVNPLLAISIGVAVLRYRLYDIDLVISRALVYASLAVFITGVYVGIVVGLGSLLGSATKPNLALSILATAVVAVAFQPLRETLTRVANRLVFGRRSSPYQVLAEFTRQVTGEEALQRMAEVLAAGTGSAQAAVYIGERRVAAYPGDSNGTALADARSVDVWHHGRRLGRLEVRKRRGELLTPLEEKLLADLANQAGLVFSNVGLAADLRLRLDELRASRQRLVQAQDSERRRLERNLHDGAQQHLVALKVRLGLAAAVAAKEPARLPQLLADLQVEADATLATMRSLAQGIYPPLLAERGLKEALESQARRATLPVAVDAAGLTRHPQEIEAAVYFCCLEALQNVQKYSQATGARVRVYEEDGVLSFEVADDGVGFDPDGAALGSGLTNIRDRLDALGGELEISSRPGGGTTVTGRIAVRVPA